MEALAHPVAPAFDAGPALDDRLSLRTLEGMTASLEERIPGMAGHGLRVSRYAGWLSRKLGLSRQEAGRIRRAAAIHDVGKIEVPAPIVNKPGPLSTAEFAIVQQHAAAGARIVAALGDPELTAIVRHHHERYDGSGYPDGLAAEQIPLGARVVAVADTFDAVTSCRAYRSARAPREGLELLAEEAGTQLAPELVAAFLELHRGRRSLLLRALAR